MPTQFIAADINVKIPSQGLICIGFKRQRSNNLRFKDEIGGKSCGLAAIMLTAYDEQP